MIVTNITDRLCRELEPLELRFFLYLKNKTTNLRKKKKNKKNHGNRKPIRRNIIRYIMLLNRVEMAPVVTCLNVSFYRLVTTTVFYSMSDKVRSRTRHDAVCSTEF
jgi:hypothetical protein